MMEEQMDAQQILERANEVVKEIRKSDAFPAIIGGIAGGIAGALMAAIIASQFAPKHPSAPVESKNGASAAKESKSPWTVQELVQLVTVIAGLARQVQTFLQAQKKQ